MTGPSWHPAFGRTIARIARRLQERREGEEKISLKVEERGSTRRGAPSGATAPRHAVDLVDVGAGEGELLAAADEALRAWGVRDQFRLVGVERSAARRRDRARSVPGATWLSSLEEIPSSSLSGLVVCYELFDALPVRALFFEGEKLLERVVTLGPDGEGFAWALAECEDGEELLERFRARGIHLLRNQKLEMRSGVARLATALAARLSSGLLLVFDYGAPARALYSAARANGTLEAFVAPRRHARRPDGARLARPDGVGRLFGGRGGPRGGRPHVEPLVSQSRVLASARDLRGAFVRPAMPPDPAREADRRAAAALVQPGGMGESIRVLLASRETAHGPLARWPASWTRPAIRK